MGLTTATWTRGQQEPRLTGAEYRANLETLLAELRKAKIKAVLMTPPRWATRPRSTAPARIRTCASRIRRDLPGRGGEDEDAARRPLRALVEARQRRRGLGEWTTISAIPTPGPSGDHRGAAAGDPARRADAERRSAPMKRRDFLDPRHLARSAAPLLGRWTLTRKRGSGRAARSPALRRRAMATTFEVILPFGSARRSPGRARRPGRNRPARSAAQRLPRPQ